MFSRSFFLPCSLFEILTSQGEITDFHSDRAPHRRGDHRDSRCDVIAGFEQGEGDGAENYVHFTAKADRAGSCELSV